MIYFFVCKVNGGNVGEMFYDNYPLKRCNPKINPLAIERIPIHEKFTSSSLSFYIHRYRADQGGIHGRLYKKCQMVIPKNATILDLKRTICQTYSKQKFNIKNISIIKGISTSSMKASHVKRKKWPHDAIKFNLPVKNPQTDKEYKKTKSIFSNIFEA